jgi:uncharacterized protein (DUF433 family)
MSDSAPAVDLTKYIEARLFGDRPHIRGRRVPVAAIAYNARTSGWDVAALAHEFTLSESEVLAALLYYQENQPLIDAQEQTEQAAMDEVYRQHGES